MARMVDRSMAKMIALKRMATGSLALGAGVAMIVVVAVQQRPLSPLILLALALFFGGGAWTLRDGVRLRRELNRTS
jgi:UDP-N-acetylmuramyl pentapeptide phosphotransferase/UDP-N-acetylglucosamine-1-phosphate transferase